MENKNNELKIEQQEQVMIPEVYSNSGKVTFTPYEFEITLGLGSSNYEGIRSVVNLRMSPQFMKDFTKILVDNINLYQENYGKIKLPEGKTELEGESE